MEISAGFCDAAINGAHRIPTNRTGRILKNAFMEIHLRLLASYWISEVCILRSEAMNCPTGEHTLSRGVRAVGQLVFGCGGSRARAAEPTTRARFGFYFWLAGRVCIVPSSPSLYSTTSLWFPLAVEDTFVVLLFPGRVRSVAPSVPFCDPVVEGS